MTAEQGKGRWGGVSWSPGPAEIPEGSGGPKLHPSRIISSIRRGETRDMLLFALGKHKDQSNCETRFQKADDFRRRLSSRQRSTATRNECSEAARLADTSVFALYS